MIETRKAPPSAAPPPGGPLQPVPRKRHVPALVAGPIVLLAVAAVAFLAIKAAYGGFGHYYYVNVNLPRSGQETTPGSEVRMHGVVIGQVSRVRLADRQVVMSLKINEPYRIPADAVAVVTLKTLLGAKYVDLRFASYRPPFLQAGAQVRAGQVGPELEDALADGVNVLDAIRPGDLATVVVNLAEGVRGQGKNIHQAIVANAELSSLFASTLQPQLRSLYDFDVVFGALRSKGIDFNQLADAVNQGVPVYASAQAQRYLQRALEALVPFSNNLADLLIYDKPNWDLMIGRGDVVLGAIAARPGGLQDLVQGLYRYVLKLGGPPYQPPFLRGGAAAGFVAFLGGDTQQQTLGQLCGALPPPVRQQLPLCKGH